MVKLYIVIFFCFAVFVLIDYSYCSVNNLLKKHETILKDDNLGGIIDNGDLGYSWSAEINSKGQNQNICWE